MKAVFIKEKGSFDDVVVEEIGKPVIAADEVLVKIKAAGVNPVDWKATLNGYFNPPHILGSDIAGTIEAIGNEVKNYKVGDEIIGSLEWAKQSAFAEFVATKEKYITYKPKNLSFAESAAVPLAALTAWQGLFDHGNLQSGQKVVIHAAAGGVGLFALQFAKWKGAYVVATASERNIDFLKSVGADEVIDYTKYKLTDKTSNADVVFDSVATPEVQLESFKVLKPGGKYVSITAGPREELLKGFDISATRFLFISNPEQLRQIVQLIEEEKVKVFVEKTFPLTEAKEALMHVHKGRTRGKVVLTPIP
ncbi:NADP-dependent oxidoreductase [Panacibacter ginsenosidivorans]|uniref:NADP-dependent oxidoreductase n=1 Tax=Panacibacter ginsenosidivorans TaxID=1813871 RepID=A0A5B8VDG4_9BACT|nr:NADP-dependent oxidoreductase [Panacibacter ginsenosidivorans]QEC69480.1 NADP-dependent oxidoreductase [Panacibacter ginsenosidivorans]